MLQSIQEIEKNLNLKRFAGVLAKEICIKCFALQNKTILLDTETDIELLVAIEDCFNSCFGWFDELISQPRTVFLTGERQAVINIAKFKLLYSKIMTVLNAVDKRLKVEDEEDFSTFDVNEVFKGLVIKFELGTEEVVDPALNDHMNSGFSGSVNMVQSSQPFSEMGSSFFPPKFGTTTSAVVDDLPHDLNLNMASNVSNNNVRFPFQEFALLSPAPQILPPPSPPSKSTKNGDLSQTVADHVQLLQQPTDADIYVALKGIASRWPNEPYRTIMMEHKSTIIPRFIDLIKLQANRVDIVELIMVLLFEMLKEWKDLKVVGYDPPVNKLLDLIEDRHQYKDKPYVRIIATVVLLHIQLNPKYVKVVLESDVLDLCHHSLDTASEHYSLISQCLFSIVSYGNIQINQRLMDIGLVPVLVRPLVSSEFYSNTFRDRCLQTLSFFVGSFTSVADAVVEQISVRRLTFDLMTTGDTTDRYFAALLISQIRREDLITDLLDVNAAPFLLELLKTGEGQAVYLVTTAVNNIGMARLLNYDSFPIGEIVEQVTSLLCVNDDYVLQCTLVLAETIANSSAADIVAVCLFGPLESLIHTSTNAGVRTRAQQILNTFKN